jgi:hypothetical protein
MASTSRPGRRQGPKRQRKPRPDTTDALSVYDGAILVGYVMWVRPCFAALDPAGQVVGKSRDRAKAIAMLPAADKVAS